ncbi:MAG: NRDE family protein [Balneolaceae bacterium]|nr:NRDE family protein [Balneolaceae bacterium]
MCLIAFSYKQHPRYDLVFAANRDEFYGRPTRGAQFWEEHNQLLAGKDLEAGGTWMGITRHGKFSALTNYRDPDNRRNDAPSRGHLVLDFLVSDDAPDSYLEDIDDNSDSYNGFNLLLGSPEQLYYYSNRSEGYRVLEPGTYGLSNHLLNTSWPKTERAKQRLSDIVGYEKIDTSALFDLLQDDQPAPDPELPDTGIPKELERAVSPIFIKTEKYGTRCSTVLLVDKNGRVTFEERRYKDGRMEVDERNRYEFELTGR